MLRPLLIILLILLMQIPLTALGAARARPQSGIGLLAIRSGYSLSKRIPILLLYREPKLGRLGERSAGQLPGLAPSLLPVDGEWYATVTGSRSGWLRIIYDEAEREGWIEVGNSFGFQKWERFLPGRQIAMLPGIREEYYSLRDEAARSSASRRSVGKGVLMSVDKVDGDWVYVKAADDPSGWIRWRDDNGRLLILLNPQIKP